MTESSDLSGVATAARPPTARPPTAGDATELAWPATSVLRVEVAGRTIWQVIGAILLTMALLGAARAASGLLTMVALSFFLSLALDPAVRSLHARYGWRRGAAVGIIYAAGLVFLSFLVYILVPAMGQIAVRVADSGDEWIARLNAWTSENLRFPIDGDVGAGVVGAGEQAGEFAANAFGRLAGITSSGISLIFNLATIAMFTFYFTADAPRIKRAVLRLLTPAAQQRIGWTWDRANRADRWAPSSRCPSGHWSPRASPTTSTAMRSCAIRVRRHRATRGDARQQPHDPRDVAHGARTTRSGVQAVGSGA